VTKVVRTILILCMVGVIAVILCAFLVHDSAWTREGIEQSMRIGNSIMDAVDAYYADNDRVPDELNDLVGKYLPEIQPPPAGLGRWSYLPEGTSDCGLLFGYGENEYPNYWITRMRRVEGWHCER
jgi:hypothetical protein